MDLPVNGFKRALAARKPQIGFWCTLPGGYAAEVLAGAGFDWLLFDTEHSPADPITVLPQLQAAAPYDVASVVRTAWNDTVLIKRFLDIGAQTLLVPYVQSRRGGAGGGGGDALPAAGGARGQRLEPRHALRAGHGLRDAGRRGALPPRAGRDRRGGRRDRGDRGRRRRRRHLRRAERPRGEPRPSGRPWPPGGRRRGRGRDHPDRPDRQAGRHPHPRPRGSPAAPSSSAPASSPSASTPRSSPAAPKRWRGSSRARMRPTPALTGVCIAPIVLKNSLVPGVDR